jgi:hypothetical protein
MRVGKRVFQRKRERAFVGIELPNLWLEKATFGRDRAKPAGRKARLCGPAAYFLRTTTHPIEYPAPNEQITPCAPGRRSSW